MELLAITGMHRSYTSLAAQFLAQCGLFLGDRLLGPGPDNRDGYFEDRDIVTMHSRNLARRRPDVYTAQPVPAFTPEERALIARKLEAMAAQNAAGLPFAFKDPRACLFLEAWKAACPGLLFVFVHRDYMRTIDSLFRRRADPSLFQSPGNAPRAWLAYNTCLLRFHAENPARSILLDGNGFPANARECVEKINAKFGLGLEPRDMNGIYKAGYTRRAVRESPLAQRAARPYRRRLDALQRALQDASAC